MCSRLQIRYYIGTKILTARCSDNGKDVSDTHSKIQSAIATSRIFYILLARFLAHQRATCKNKMLGFAAYEFRTFSYHLGNIMLENIDVHVYMCIYSCLPYYLLFSLSIYIFPLSLYIYIYICIYFIYIYLYMYIYMYIYYYVSNYVYLYCI